MLSERLPVSKAKHLKLYLFLSAFAVNFFLEVIMIANGLSIQYFFYTAPMTIRIEFLSTLGNVLLWVGSFYLVYITKEVAEKTPRFRRFHNFLNIALIGSFFLIFSVFLTIIGASAEPAVIPSLNQLWFLAVAVGYTLSFTGSSFALFTVMTQNKGMLRLFLIYLFSLLITIEIWSLLHWIVYPFDVISHLGFAWRGAFTELQMFYLSYPLIFWLFILFLFSWIWVPLAIWIDDRIKLKQRLHVKTPLFGSQRDTKLSKEVTNERTPEREDDPTHEASTSRLALIAVLLVSLLLGVFIAYYPYIHPKSGLVGWDSLGYYLSLSGMVDTDLYGAMQFTATTDRPLYFLLLYFFRSLTQLPSNTIIEIMPIVTILANALAVFWFVKIGGKKALVASVAAIFSIFSVNTTVAMHAGILANWLAMALGFTMFSLVLKLQEKVSLKLLFVAILVLASAFFVHYWSTVFFLLVLGCYALLTLLQRGSLSTKFVVALAVLASVALVAIFSSGFALNFFISYGFTENINPPEAFVLFWTRLPIFIDSWFFGALANPVMIALALIGIVVCFYQRTNFCRILISWTVVGSLLSIFVSPIGRYTNQWLTWRTLYLIPFQIPATLGLFFLVAKLRSLKQSSRNIQSDDGDVRHVESSSSLLKDENLKMILYIIVNFIVCALLLTLDFPILGALIFLNYLVLTLIINFKIRKRADNSILVFMFVMLVVLLLLNYALRSLAPLTVHRMQPS